VRGLFSASRLLLRPLEDYVFGQSGLLAHTVRNVGKFAFIGTNCWQVVGSADKVEGAEGFPDLFIAGIDGGDLGSCSDNHSCWNIDGTDAASDR